MNRPPTDPYHQAETVFTGERQKFSDAGLSPDDPAVQQRMSKGRRAGDNSQLARKKKPRKKS